MDKRETLPADFLASIKDLEPLYLRTSDPIRQSGFGGGPERWRREREPILEAIDESGDLLDIGCANGYLLECLVCWGRERGFELIPYGVDLNLSLLELANERHPAFKGHFFVANAWEWQPKRRFKYVYTLSHCVPDPHLESYIERLLKNVVQPDGKLIVGDYTSRSQDSPLDFRERLKNTGLSIQGTAVAGTPLASSFAWLVNA